MTNYNDLQSHTSESSFRVVDVLDNNTINNSIVDEHDKEMLANNIEDNSKDDNESTHAEEETKNFVINQSISCNRSRFSQDTFVIHHLPSNIGNNRIQWIFLLVLERLKVHFKIMKVIFAILILPFQQQFDVS